VVSKVTLNRKPTLAHPRPQTSVEASCTSLTAMDTCHDDEIYQLLHRDVVEVVVDVSRWMPKGPGNSN
jgi:hypothetical protein